MQANLTTLLDPVALAIRGQGATPITLYPANQSPRETRGLITQELGTADSGDLAYVSNSVFVTVGAGDASGVVIGDRVAIEGRNYRVAGITAGSSRHFVYRLEALEQ